MTLTNLLDAAERQARRVMFKKRNPHLPPTWVLFDGKDNRIVATPWRNEEERELAQISLKILIAEKKIVAYSCLSEAWVATEPKDWKPGMPHVQPRHRPDRKEAVVAMATDGKDAQQKMWTIVRDWHEQVIKLEPVYGGYSQLGGWMISLLGEPTKFL